MRVTTDFTSSLYLGFRHPPHCLPPWHTLTEGRPSALRAPPAMQELAGTLAQLQGLERGVLGQSTLHLFWDFINWLSQKEVRLFYDTNAYPIGCWSLACRRNRGIGLHRVAHYHPEALQQSLANHLRRDERPVLLLDGYCPVSGQLAPLPSLLKVIEDYDGLLLIDDTQALGIFGQQASGATPYGRDGGGSLRYHHIHSSQVVMISSLAKAFGVPAAVLTGPDWLIAPYQRESLTAVHCSPVSNAHLAALRLAIKLNREQGNLLRRQLYQRVQLFRRLMKGNRNGLLNSIHPFQTLAACHDATERYQALRRKGIEVVLHQKSDDTTALSCLIRVEHHPAQIRQLAQLLVD